MAATSQAPIRGRITLTESGAPKAAGSKRASSPSAALSKGQIWKFKDTYIQVVDAGKTLIHYTMSPKPRQRGLRVHMATRETVQDFLKSNRAKLLP